MAMHLSLSRCFGGMIKLFGNTSQERISKTNRRPRLYDVFINHRGVDTKRNMAALLYDRFVHLQLQSFLDCQSLRPGDLVFNRIEAAIQDYKVALVIFSPKYCSSYSCLHELALITEYEKKILPIFYDIMPSDLVLV